MRNLTAEAYSTYPRERYAVLLLAALTNMVVVAAPGMSISVLFKEISQDLGLNLVQVGLIWGISSLPGIVSILLGGAAGDRFGPKRILVASCLACGLTGAMRGFVQDFPALLAVSLLLGFLAPFVITNNLKICSSWFPSYQLGLASGVLSMGMAGGFLAGSFFSATWLSPMLGGWRNVMIFYGVIGMLFVIPWAFLSRETPVQNSQVVLPERPSIGQGIRHVAGIRAAWLLGITVLGVGGCIQGALGYLPLHLRSLGWTPVAADAALSVFHTVSLLFVVPIALWSDRLGSRRQLLLGASLMIALGVGLLAFADGWLVWVAVCLAGIVRDGFMAVLITTVIETRGIGAKYAGTGPGFVLLFLNVGSLIAPPVGNSLVAVSPGAPFLFWAALTGLAVAGLGLLKDHRE